MPSRSTVVPVHADYVSGPEPVAKAVERDFRSRGMAIRPTGSHKIVSKRCVLWWVIWREWPPFGRRQRYLRTSIVLDGPPPARTRQTTLASIFIVHQPGRVKNASSLVDVLWTRFGLHWLKLVYWFGLVAWMRPNSVWFTSFQLG